MDEFDIYIRSFRATVAERPEHALRRVFGLDEEQARDFVTSLPRVVKRRVPATERPRYEKVLDAMGAELEFRRSPIQPMGAVLVKGAASGPASREQARQPGALLTLGEPLLEADGFVSAERPAPVWPSPRSTVIDPDGALTPAPATGPAPPAPPVSIHPVEPPVPQLEPGLGAGFGTAPTQRMAAVSVPNAAPPTARPPTPSAGTPVPTWTVANTPAGSNLGEAFAGLPVRGPAHPTLRQQPTFGAETAKAPVPAASAPEAAASAGPAVVPLVASPALAPAEAAALAVGWQGSPPAARAAASARPGPKAESRAVPDAVRAYAEASTADSLAREPQGAGKAPSWLVDESSLRQQIPSASPPALRAASDLGMPMLGEPVQRALSLDPGGPAAPELALELEAPTGPGGAWLLAAGHEGGVGRARGGAQRAAPRDDPKAAALIAGAGQPAVVVSRIPPAGAPAGSAAHRPSAQPPIRARSRPLAADAASLPFGVRLLVRAGLGVSLFLLLLTFRACPFRKSAVERELSQWDTTGEPGAGSPEQSGAVQSPTARDWIEAGNHHFRDPHTGDVVVDKDPIRGLVSRLFRQGATEVYVYGVTPVDLIIFADGLDVVLPEDEAKRAALFLEEARFHRRDAPSVPDTGQARLRIAVP